ncbi:MAG: hypothetical protein FWG30_08645 [Eubacteriaceae bacterium]|nr:hypothetical protein [Eubacteriaceae bacterium]
MSISTVYEEAIASVTIRTAPDYSLAGCLIKYNLPNENISDIYDETIERFKLMLAVLDDEGMLSALSEISALSANRQPYSKRLNLDMLYMLVRMFIFIYKFEEQQYLVMPDELRILYEKSDDTKMFIGEAQNLIEMKKYATACLNLYGAFEAGRFAEVWNRYHKEKIDEEEAMDFFLDYRLFISSYYIFDDCYIVHTDLIDEDLDDLLERLEEMDIGYYMPTKSVINTYGEAGMRYEKTEYLIKLKEFIYSIFTDDDVAENVLGHITHPNLAGYIDIIYTHLADAGFPFENEQAINTFEKLYESFYLNMRDWDYCGYTQSQVALLFDLRTQPFKLDGSLME